MNQKKAKLVTACDKKTLKRNIGEWKNETAKFIPSKRQNWTSTTNSNEKKKGNLNTLICSTKDKIGEHF